LDDLRAFLVAKGFPGDTQFGNALLRFNLYQSRYTLPVLTALERAQNHKEPADLTQTQIEHIMPQTLTEAWKTMLGSGWATVHDEWKHTLGNLTLTAYNQELGNKTFLEKRDGFQGFTGYRNSNIVLTRKIEKYDEWTDACIMERGKKLVAQALTLWPSA
jgi:hypothetical protein